MSFPEKEAATKSFKLGVTLKGTLLNLPRTEIPYSPTPVLSSLSASPQHVAPVPWGSNHHQRDAGSLPTSPNCLPTHPRARQTQLGATPTASVRK